MDNKINKMQYMQDIEVSTTQEKNTCLFHFCLSVKTVQAWSWKS